jgi:hypothetical protein
MRIAEVSRIDTRERRRGDLINEDLFFWVARLERQMRALVSECGRYVEPCLISQVVGPARRSIPVEHEPDLTSEPIDPTQEKQPPQVERNPDRVALVGGAHSRVARSRTRTRARENFAGNSRLDFVSAKVHLFREFWLSARRR